METLLTLYVGQIRTSRIPDTGGELFALEEWQDYAGGRWVIRWLSDGYAGYLADGKVLVESRPFWLDAGVILRTRHYGNVAVERVTTRDNPPKGTAPSFVPRQVGFSGEMRVKPNDGDWFAAGVTIFQELSTCRRVSGFPL